MTTRDLFAPDDWIDPAPPSSKTIKERYALELQVLAEIRSGTREVRYIIPPSNGYEGCHTFDAVLGVWGPRPSGR